MTTTLLDHFLTFWREGRPKITFLPHLDDGLPLGSMKLKWSYISTHLSIRWFAEHFLKDKASGKVILHLSGHRAYYSSPSLLQTAVENSVTIYLYCCTMHLVDSIIITKPTNALFVCNLFLNHFFKTLSLLLHVSIAYCLSSSGSTYSS